MNALDIPNRLDPDGNTCRAIVETPAGHRSKFDYDPDTGLFEVAGVLPAGMAFPMAFGFVPRTLAEDGDPIDILILADEDLPVGCLVTVALLGVMEAEQTEQGETCRNDRLIGRVLQSRMYADVDDLAALGNAAVDELSRFFVEMNALKGKSFEVKAIGDASRACSLIEAGIRKREAAEQ
jgi:inorganic pyrophosphatase